MEGGRYKNILHYVMEEYKDELIRYSSYMDSMHRSTTLNDEQLHDEYVKNNFN